MVTSTLPHKPIVHSITYVDLYMTSYNWIDSNKSSDIYAESDDTEAVNDNTDNRHKTQTSSKTGTCIANIATKLYFNIITRETKVLKLILK